MLLADNRAWSTKGSFALEVTHRGDADGEPADVSLVAANLEICIPDDELVLESDMALRSEPATPLRVSPGATERISYSFEAAGATDAREDGWLRWCGVIRPPCPAGPEGLAKVLVTGSVVDTLSASSSSHERGETVAVNGLFPFEDGRIPLEEPQAVGVGAVWSQRLEGYYGTIGLAIDEAGKSVLLARRAASPHELTAFDATGSLRWSHDVPEAFIYGLHAPLASRAGSVLVTGTMNQPEGELFGQTLSSAGSFDAYAMLLDDTGTLLWGRTFGDGLGQQAYDAALAEDGRMILLVRDEGNTDWGGGRVGTSALSTLVVLDASGAHLSSRRIGSHQSTAASLALLGSGSIAVAGYLEDPVDFGGGTIGQFGTRSVFVAVFDGAGQHKWSREFQSSDGIIGIEADPQGNLYAALENTIDREAVVWKLDANGEQLEMNLVPGVPLNNRRFAVDASGRALLVSWETFVLMHESRGALTTSHTIACSGQSDWRMATGPSGDVAMAGEFGDLAALDQGALVGSATLLARIQAP